jgi:molybdate transport system substrate-binding protein
MAASKESRNTAREKPRFEVLSAATKELNMSVNSFRRSLLIAFLSTFLAWPIQGSAVHAAEVTVFAAASLKNALDNVAKAYEAKTGDKVIISFAASSALAKQIEGGATADIFFSADLDWMDYLEKKKLIDSASRRTLLGNTLVLIAPKDSKVSLTIEKNFPLLQALGADGKLAMASVDSVPAGKYGKAALTYLGVWEAWHRV